jgi:D-tyrosyl-tRNA(Tyr) deacylase
MRAVIQRVSEASVIINGLATGTIQHGLVVLLGIEDADTEKEVSWLAKKIVNMRIFGDDQGLMNKSLIDIDGRILLISQFTLLAQTQKGNRPSFIHAAKPDRAIPLYEQMIEALEINLGKKIATGIFGENMKVSLVNDGPVTIIMNTEDKDNY